METSSTISKEELLQQRNVAYSSAVPHSIPGLYPSFPTAVTILRIARSLGDELETDSAEEERHLDAFFDKLSLVENFLLHRDPISSETTNSNSNANENDKLKTPFIVLIEGLDGTGKTSLVQGLAQTLPNATAWSTPTASMAHVRDIFDRRGGAVARAFYMASNYVLLYEIQHAYRGKNEIFLVDRWYASTCAYSIGWKNTSGTPEESVDLLDQSLFQWPRDLQPPDILLLLQVDDPVRKERVQHRREQQTMDNHNPWDGRLDADENLGKRILRAMERVSGIRHVVQLDANQTRDKVLQDALRTIWHQARQHYGIPKPVTVAITGTHCAGKGTIGRKLAELLGWRFDPELGDLLREKVVASGHLTGDGSGSKNAKSWDNRVHAAEIARDLQSFSCRVVETWHIGNLAWAITRATKHPSFMSEEWIDLSNRAKDAIRHHQLEANVLLVHLTVVVDAMHRRRKRTENVKRVPMTDDQIECQELHSALDEWVVDFLVQEDLKDLGVPNIVIDNSLDGDKAIEATARAIAHFVRENTAE